MKNDGWIGKRGFRYYYYRYRDSQYYSFGIIGAVIFVCTLLVVFVILPEINQLVSIQNEVASTQQNIQVLQNNLTFINTMDKGNLATQLQTVSQALPPEKNFGLILNSISNASITSGVTLTDYAFQVGNIKNVPNTPSDGSPQDAVTVTVVVSGNVDAVKKFIFAIENSLPIAEVTAIDGSGNSDAITIQFYQKPFPTIGFNPEDQLSPLTQNKLSLLQKLEKWSASGQPATSSDNSASASATDVPLF